MPYIKITFDQAIELGPENVPEGPKCQGGISFHTLCRQCNNDFGSRYAPAFIRWCYQGMHILERSGGNPRLVYAHHINPLRVIKQIVAMFFSVNSDHFRQTQVGRELAWLLKNSHEKGLPKDVRFYTYFNVIGRPRYAPISSLARFNEGNVHVFSEITYPPYGYLMALGTEPPNRRLFDITHFAWSELGEERTVFLDLPVMPTHLTTVPGDYRTLDQINEQKEKNKRYEEGSQERNISEQEGIRMLDSLDRANALYSRYRGG